jgi:hypothetical protein
MGTTLVSISNVNHFFHLTQVFLEVQNIVHAFDGQWALAFSPATQLYGLGPFQMQKLFLIGTLLLRYDKMSIPRALQLSSF